MVKVIFDQPTYIDDVTQLRKLYGTDRLSLEPSASILLEGEVTLGTELVLSGFCRFLDGTHIGNGCILTSVELGYRNEVRPYSILSKVKTGDGNLFGPFCFIRDDCTVGDNCILGAHVEATRSVFSSGVKVSHHAFIGDADVGERTIIGAGVIFCNYDGTGRQTIKVGSDVILGSGTLLVAPLSIGDEALIAAGSTITKDIPKNFKIIQKR